MLSAGYALSAGYTPATTPHLNNPCIDPTTPQSKQPWCDATLPIDARVKDMISRMSVAEKIDALDTTQKAIGSLGLVAYNWWSEATHGISHVGNTPSKGTQYETNFAFPITTAMSFNRTMWWATGQQIGREARAFMNVGDAWSTFWAPVINLAREPRWGRNLETPGEDPYQSGEYATAWVQGFEKSTDDPTHLQASACCKHYVANSMEQSTVAGETWQRYDFDANVTMQDLVDSYLLPFQACVEKGKVSGLMCSYNAVNGVPSCANSWLLTEVARGAWGFDGYITSDCDADANVFNAHHYTATPEETVADVLHAGTDVDCTSFVGQHAQSALDKGLITVADMDVRLSYLFRVRMRLGHFDPVGPLQKIPTSDVCTPYAKELARDGVRQSVVLLKNDKATLPLDPSKLKKVAVLGPQANYSKSVAGYYAGNSCDGYGLSDDDGIAKAIGEVVPTLTHTILASSTAADLSLLPTAAASASPLVVVFFGSTPLDISPLLADPKVGAIVHVGQPSVQLGGVADVIFGKVSPAGKTVQTILPKPYMDMISIFDFNMRPGPSLFPRPDCPKPYDSCTMGTNPGRTHRFYTGKPVVPFGYGLSYTTFKYAPYEARGARVAFLAPVHAMLAAVHAEGRTFPSSDALAAAAPLVNYWVNVTNTGSVDSDDVVLGFVVPPGAGKEGIPLQTLFGFERIHVKAGKTVSVNLYPSLAEFTHTRLDGTKAAVPGEYVFKFGVKSTAPHGQGYAEMKLTVA